LATFADDSRDLAAELVNFQSTFPSSPGRRRRREERGLPSDEGLRNLAQTYLETQHRLWPELVVSGHLPAITANIIADMASRFKQAFLAKTVPLLANPAGTLPASLAASYLRYSCDNSNPCSLDQQLRLQLERGRQNGHFIPWDRVFADAAVTGTTAKRTGYELAQAALKAPSASVGVLYIDEIGRASRDMIEALKLGRDVARQRKRLIGVSDGFDTDTPGAKIQLSFYAALHESFVDQLRAKVRRGMHDAFHRGTNTGLPALGYKLVPAQDAAGRPLTGKDGEPLKALAIDDKTSCYVLLAYQLYGEKGRSLVWIGRRFNRQKVGGLETWDGSRVRQLLKRRLNVGILAYNMTHQVRDPDTGRVTVLKVPQEEWLVRRARHLQIVPWHLWKLVQHRLKECGRAFFGKGGPSQDRTDLYPKALIRPICGVCGKPLMLGRSGKYASFCCLNGIHEKHGCTFRGYKSASIVESAVLSYLREHVLTPDRVEELILKANEYLTAQAAKPKANLAPVDSKIRKARAARDRLVALLERVGEQNLDAVVARLRKLEEDLCQLRNRRSDLVARNHVPPSIDRAAADGLLQDLRGLLNQDVAHAAPILGELTGPVVVRQRREPGKARTIWFAEFTVNLVPVVAKLAAGQNCPTAGVWEYLNTRRWTIHQRATAMIRHVPQYELLGEQFKKLHEGGASVQSIAAAHGMPWKQANEILQYGLTGKRPAWKNHHRTGARKEQDPLYVQIASEVASLRDNQQLSWPKMIAHFAAKRIKVGENTLRRAYDRAHPEIARAAADSGQTPKRDRYSHIAVRERFRKLLQEGRLNHTEIARLVGCSLQTVGRERAEMHGGKGE